MDTRERTKQETDGWPDGASTLRRRSFRVVSVLFILLATAMFAIPLAEIVFMWLPGDTLASIFDEEVSEITQHRSHFMAIGVMAWTLVPSLLAQLRKPWRRVGSMTLVAIVVIAGTILYGLSGTLGEWLAEEITILVPVAAMVALHPRRTDILSVPKLRQVPGLMAGAAAVAWAVYLGENAWRQWTNLAGDPHAEMEHWATAGLMAVAISAAALIGASDHDGWRLPAWIATLASIVFGVHSLAFPGLASALPTLWAIAAIAWGVGFGFVTVLRGATEADEKDTAPVGAPAGA